MDSIFLSFVLTFLLSSFSSLVANDCDNSVPTWRPKPNIDSAMLGIDLAHMKPMPKPEKNPARKMPIFQSVYQDSQGLFQPHTFFGQTDILICSPNFKEESWSWNGTQSYLASSMSDWSLGYQGPEVSFETSDNFGATITPTPNSALDDEGTKDLEKFFQNERGSISRSTAKCSVYDVTIDIHDSSLALTPNFKEGIKKIDKAETDEEKDMTMKQFISDFGTHFARKSTMGIGIQFETRYTELETIQHDQNTLRKCNTRTGKLGILGYQGPEPEVSDDEVEASITTTMFPITTYPPYTV